LGCIGPRGSDGAQGTELTANRLELGVLGIVCGLEAGDFEFELFALLVVLDTVLLAVLYLASAIERHLHVKLTAE
jgi:hypothetical protein